MLRHTLYISCVLFLITGFAYITSSRDKINNITALGRTGIVNIGHQCRWDLCPYKGVIMKDATNAVSDYTGEACTDAYYIDMLHIQYPTLDADQLDSLLFTTH
jgi:hypothetical protein